MNWIKLEKNKQLKDSENNFLVWIENLSTPKCSGAETAEKDGSYLSVFSHGNFFLGVNGFYECDDFGDLCRITHFAIIDNPNKP